jgi:uncharacterized protein YbjQ (UPF0145 family)
MIDLLVFLTLLVLGYVAGSIAEKRHFRSIAEREKRFLRQPAVTFAERDASEVPGRSRLVSGSAVVSVDYFKRFLAGLRMIFGGRVSAYESLLDRARREAILRMRLQAAGAREILGVRVETATIYGRRRRKGLGSVEAFAYGTAVWPPKSAVPPAAP